MLAGTPAYEFDAARVVSHLTTQNHAKVQIGDITIKPDNRMPEARIRRLIPTPNIRGKGARREYFGRRTGCLSPRMQPRAPSNTPIGSCAPSWTDSSSLSAC
ncbi:hypothetical protein [Nocardia abscessus]|uniref:hypothetical protein n=1 Tax=Nocardia abscessus TaxID=120957 RepID=UPI0024565B8B|nr:hypothetical protein [Nocardia abscessus]